MKKLEDIFNAAFDGFEEEPSGNVWDGIANDREQKLRTGITDASTESEFSQAFRNFSSQPSARVWEGIKQYTLGRIFKQKLYKYAALLLLLLATGGGSLFLLKRGGEDKGSAKLDKPSVSLASPNASDHATIKENPVRIQPQTRQLKETAMTPVIEQSDLIASNNANNTVANHQAIGNIRNNTAEPQNSTVPVTPHEPSLAVSAPAHRADELTSDVHKLADPANIAQKPEQSGTSEPNTLAAIDQEKEVKTLETQDEKRKPNLDENKTKLKKDQDKKGNNYVQYTRETDINNSDASFKLGFSAGTDYAGNYIKGGTNLYQDLRKNNELYRPSYHFGLSAAFMLSSGIYIQTGANFLNRAYNVAYDKKLTHDSTIIGPGGSSTTIKVVDYTINAKTHYAYSSFEFPLLLGYNCGEHRLSGHFLGGAMINILVDKRGEVLSPTTMQIASVKDAGQFPYVNVGWGVMLVGGVSYQIKHEWSVTIDVPWRYSVTSIFGEQFPVSQKPHSTGVNVGMRYHFR